MLDRIKADSDLYRHRVEDIKSESDYFPEIVTKEYSNYDDTFEVLASTLVRIYSFNDSCWYNIHHVQSYTYNSKDPDVDKQDIYSKLIKELVKTSYNSKHLYIPDSISDEKDIIKITEKERLQYVLNYSEKTNQ